MANTPILFLSRSGEWWDTGLIVSAIIAGLAATTVGVFTAGSILAHKREAEAAEIALDAYKVGVDDRVADAKLAGIKAGLKAGEASGIAERAKADVFIAQADVARANQKAAEANARAEEAALALAKFAAPRLLATGQRDRISRLLGQYSGTPYVISIQLSGEVIDFERQLVEVLAKAGWKQRPMPHGITYTVPDQPPLGLVSLTGISIYVDESRPDLFAAVNALKGALETEGFVVDGKRIIDGSEDVKDAVHLYVGEKPRPN